MSLLKEDFEKRMSDLLTAADGFSTANTPKEKRTWCLAMVLIAQDFSRAEADRKTFLGERTPVIEWLENYPQEAQQLYAAAWIVHDNLLAEDVAIAGNDPEWVQLALKLARKYHLTSCARKWAERS